jgi:hypothetical protein
VKRKKASVPRGVSLRYVGDGQYLPGVPARDLSADEAAQHLEAINAHARTTGRTLYAPIEAQSEGE